MIKLYHNLFKLHDGILPNLKAGSYIESRFFLSFINHYLTNAYVSLAIINSSFVGMANTLIFESAVEINASSPITLFACESN